MHKIYVQKRIYNKGTFKEKQETKIYIKGVTKQNRGTGNTLAHLHE